MDRSALKRLIEFYPAQRLDGRWAIGIHIDGGLRPVSFVHWIDREAGRVAKVNRRDIAWSVYHIDEAEAVCELVAQMYAEGAIE